jgi:hypothetical protein
MERVPTQNAQDSRADRTILEMRLENYRMNRAVCPARHVAMFDQLIESTERGLAALGETSSRFTPCTTSLASAGAANYVVD